MFSNIILLFIVILLTVFIIHSKTFKDLLHSESSLGEISSDAFLDFPDPTNPTLVSNSATKFNALTNTIDVTNPSVPFTPSSSNALKQALMGVQANPTDTKYSLQSSTLYDIPKDTPAVLKYAKQCEAAPKTCDAFNDPTFAANCGMSFDTTGTGSDGKPFTGGLYLSPDDRATQTATAKNVEAKGVPPYDPYKVYQPTIGTAKPGTFSLNKDQCLIVKEKADCSAKQTFGSPNCTQCYTSQAFSYVSPKTGRLPSTLYLFGTGSVSVTSTDSAISLKQTALGVTNAVSVVLPATAEGAHFTIQVTATATTTTYIGGYLEGPTARGTFKLDITHLIVQDTVTGLKPRLSGRKLFNGFTCTTILPGSGKTAMGLACMMPFSFMDIFDRNALTCDNGPIVTKAESATFLETDPCYSKANSPGNYTLECLQSRWTQLGGTAKGTGYPSTPELAITLQKGKTIDEIVTALAPKMAQAQTGKNADGAVLALSDWNDVSMYTTGVPINTPCDGPGGVPPLSKECLSYLYTNQGAMSHLGATYSQGSGVVSEKTASAVAIKETFTDSTGTYNYPGTPADPTTPAGLQLGQSLGGVEAVKQKYDAINRLANDNTKTNAERSVAIQQAYGIALGSPTSNSNDFDVRIPANQPTKSYDDMKQLCESKGQRLCHSSEICDMQQRTVINPELTSTFPGDNWIAVGDNPNEWLTLNRDGGRYCKTHTEVTGGLPSWGTTTGSSNMERLAKCCSGTNDVVHGQYIRLQYNRQDFLNLTKIEVYTDSSDSSNIITPNTIITKSSNYDIWDSYPARNMVNNTTGNLIAITAWRDIPWIMVNLGSVMPIYKVVVTNRRDCCRERILGTSLIILNPQMKPVYHSHPVTSTNLTYTWFPPNPTNYVDYTGSKPEYSASTTETLMTVHGDNGTTTCERYCSGVNGGPWDGSLPAHWNGATCADVDPVIGNCYNRFEGRGGAGCVCKKTGTGWRTGGWLNQ